MPQYLNFPPEIAPASALDISAATQVKATPGYIYSVNVTTVGTTNGSIYDMATGGTPGAGNLLAEIPMAVGTYPIKAKTANGLYLVPGTGMVLSVTYL